MKRILASLALSALALVAAFANAKPGPVGLDKIAAYAGTWKGETENFATAYSKASHETAMIHNDSWRSGDFYVIHQIVNGKPAPVLSVYTYDAKADLYHVNSVPTDGSDPGPAGKLIIKDNVWTFPWEYTDKGKTVYFRVVNVFTTPKAIEYRQEYSTDQVHWTVMGKGTEHKIR